MLALLRGTQLRESIGRIPCESIEITQGCASSRQGVLDRADENGCRANAAGAGDHEQDSQGARMHGGSERGQRITISRQVRASTNGLVHGTATRSGVRCAGLLTLTLSFQFGLRFPGH